MPKYARVDWDRIRRELVGGKSVAELAEQYAIGAQTIKNKASMERWELGKAKAAILREVAGGKDVEEIEVEIERIGRRLRGLSLKCRAELGEQVEEVLREMRGMPVAARSRCLASMAIVAERVFRWGDGPRVEEIAAAKGWAINTRLINTSPLQLRQMARHVAKKAEEQSKEEAANEGPGDG